jgi:hypothetical protein
MIESLHDRFDAADALRSRHEGVAWELREPDQLGIAACGNDRAYRGSGVRTAQARKIAAADELVAQADAGFRQALDKNDRAIAMMPSYAPAHLNRAMILKPTSGIRRAPSWNSSSTEPDAESPATDAHRKRAAASAICAAIQQLDTCPGDSPVSGAGAKDVYLLGISCNGCPRARRARSSWC